MNTYNINSVSKLTGLTAFVIRAWEKRYNVVVPQRTDTNRRVYSEADIEKLQLLKEAVDRGNSIGSIAGLSVEDLRVILSKFRSTEELYIKSSDPEAPKKYLNKCLDSIMNLDNRALESFLVRASIEFSLPVLIDKLILPLLTNIGTFWHNGTLRIAQEHMASAVIRTFLYNLKDSYKPSAYNSRIIITTPYGQNHEFGALITSVIAASEGWDAIYLGPDLPASEIIAASEQLKPKVVAISIVFITEDIGLSKEIEKLQYLPKDVKLIAGGRGVGAFRQVIERIDGTVMEDFDSFRNALKKSA